MFTKYIDTTGRPLSDTSIDDIPLAEQEAFFASNGEMSEQDADRLYAAWHASQVDSARAASDLAKNE